MDPQIRVYISGPMSFYPGFNFASFDAAAHQLRAAGFTVFNPADRDRTVGFDPLASYTNGHEDLAALGFDLRAALSADLDYVTRKADAVAVLPGWERSSGARAEVATAHALGLPVARVGRFFDNELPAEGDRIKPDTSAPPYQNVSMAGAREEEDRAKIAALLERAVEAVEPSDCGAPMTVGVSGHTGAFRRPHPADRFSFTKPEPLLNPAMWEQLKDAAAGEVRTTSSTGGQKGVKPEMFSLLPVEALEHVARHYGIGAAKYDKNQWRKGYEWSKSYDAAMRHLTAFWRGEDIDAETGSRHLAAVAFHALTLLVFMDEQPDHDDRYRKETP